MNITEKAMLIHLNISQWTARRFDLQATNKVINDFQARRDSGRFNKMLVDLDAVKKYQKVSNVARTFHYENTLPWGDDGARILPAENYLLYTQKMRDLKIEFDAAVNDFISEYPDLIRRAENDLNGLFRSQDYPDPAALRDKFSLSVSVSPVPDSDDFRVSLTDDEVDRIKQDIELRVKDSVSAAMGDLWDRLFKCVKHMADKLKDQKAVFRDSLVGNIRELCDLLPRLNLTSDPDLDAMIHEVRSSLSGLDPEVLRKHEIDRRVAADSADDILKKMASYMGE